MIWKRVFKVENGWGENGLTQKSFENLFSSQSIEFPFFKRERLFELFFLCFFFYASFSFSFFLCSVSLLRMNSGIFEMFEVKTIFFQIYKIGGVMENLSVVDAYPRMDLCTPIIFFSEASSKIWRRKNLFEKFKSSSKTHPLTKLNENKSFYVKYIWLW
jgi:hypothetical protein